MRALANTLLKLIGISKTRELLQLLKINKNFSIYETANYSIFRAHDFRTFSNYVVSEYYNDSPPGSIINGTRNENLEKLSFHENSFDVIISSDVLEHVSDIDKALSEIKRVLKPGGYHIFTIPVDYKMDKTTERAIVINGLITNLLEPVMHGDTVRNNGILAFRDFGKDVINYLSRNNLECKEVKYTKNNMHITSVYYAQKTLTVV
jgi:SAM-dependent methyltransferase